MRPSDKLQAMVDAYLEATKRYVPKFIVMTEHDYAELRESVCHGLAKELHYNPRFFHGIPLVVSKTEPETRCLP